MCPEVVRVKFDIAVIDKINGLACRIFGTTGVEVTHCEGSRGKVKVSCDCTVLACDDQATWAVLVSVFVLYVERWSYSSGVSTESEVSGGRIALSIKEGLKVEVTLAL